MLLLEPYYNVLNFSGTYRCWGYWGCRLCFCADPSPWSTILVSPRLPAKNIVWCSSLNCRRQDEGDRISWWWLLQIWGEYLKVTLYGWRGELAIGWWKSTDHLLLPGAGISTRAFKPVDHCRTTRNREIRSCCSFYQLRGVALLGRLKDKLFLWIAVIVMFIINNTWYFFCSTWNNNNTHNIC